ncbi:MAG: MarR family transcriptional regulator [Anaerolineales bacterium]|nr:MarR family transcriptional regulator [Anaerolineales bacterium]
MTPNESASALQNLVEVFWETVPPLWREIHAHLHAVAAEEYDVTVEQFHILRHIRQGSASVSELAKQKRISRPAVSQIVETLVQRGLIQRKVNPQDRRQIVLELTESGNALLDAISQRTRHWTMQLFAPLTSEEMQQITHSLERLKKLL